MPLNYTSFALCSCCSPTIPKSIAVWLVLKNETITSVIQAYRKQLSQLASKCKMCVRTFNKYIAWLRTEGLVTVTGSHLQISNLQVLKQYNINPRKRNEIIYYDPNEKQTLPEILIAIGMQEMQDRLM